MKRNPGLDQIALSIVCFSVAFSTLSMMVMRYSSRLLASELSKKRQEDVFWLEMDKSQHWYALTRKSTVPEIESKFIEMIEDKETKEFIQQSVAQSDSWILQTWYNLAKSFMSLFGGYYSQTDMNAILQRGSMFVLSTEQFEMLLNHGGISSDELSSRKDTATLIDLGAGPQSTRSL